MDPTTLAGALMWVWFALAPPSAPGYADQLTDDVMQIRQPQTVRFQISGQLAAAGQSLPMRGNGGFVQPDRFQLAVDLGGFQVEEIGIGNTLYVRSSNDPTWRAQR